MAVAARAPADQDAAPDLLLVGYLAERAFAIPAVAVDRIVRMVALTPLPGAPPHVVGLINVQGAVLPVVDPRPLLGVPTSEPHPDQDLVILSAPHRYVLWLDRITEVSRATPADFQTICSSGEPGPASLVMRLDDLVIPVLSVVALAPGPIIDPTRQFA
jgi:purine-binding chemotaxis protein CheW